MDFSKPVLLTSSLQIKIYKIVYSIIYLTTLMKMNHGFTTHKQKKNMVTIVNPCASIKRVTHKSIVDKHVHVKKRSSNFETCEHREV